jgi:hypothetical protein
MKGGITQVPIIQQYLLLTYELLIQIWQILFVFYLEQRNIIFKPSGSFSFAKNYLSKKASKAMFCIRKTLYSEKLNAFLLDARVKPILLYCSEIWSLDILIKRNSNFESLIDKECNNLDLENVP